MTDPAKPMPETRSIERQLQMLGRLAEVGLELAGAIERRIKAAEAAQSPADLNVATTAYARVAREVRLSVLLQNQMIKDSQDRSRQGRRDLGLEPSRGVPGHEAWAQDGRRGSLAGSPFTTLPSAAALADEVRAFKAVRPLRPGAGRRSGR